MKTLKTGCYIDGAMPRNDAERILKLADMLAEIDPNHSLLRELLSITPRHEFEEGLADEYLAELEDAINEALPENLIAKWDNGDFLVLENDTDY